MRHRIMVVEDEPIERRALLLTLRNSFPELEVVAEAATGPQALTLYHETRPDIVLIDVGIPGLDGLEVIKRMNEDGRGTGFIIISSHDNFEYAQRAIKLGVEDYLLKPASVEALGKAIGAACRKRDDLMKVESRATKLLERVEKIRPLVENDFIYDMISGNHPAGLKQMLAFLGYESPTGFCMLILEKDGMRRALTMVESALKDVGYRLLCGFYKDMSVFCVLLEQLDDSALNEVVSFSSLVLKNCGHPEYHIGAGDLVNEPEGWTKSYRRALAALEHARANGLRFKVYEHHGTDVPQGASSGYLAAAAGVISHALIDNRTESYPALLQKTMQSLVGGNPIRNAAEDAYKLLVLIEQELMRTLPTLKDDVRADTAVMRVEDHKQLEAALFEHIHKLDETVKSYRDRSKNQIVDQALFYVGNQFDKEISLDTIAREIDVSPYYLSRLLKRHTGKTCTELICERRIEEAKKLLRKNLSSKEVAYMAGFNSQNYFTRVFKKYTGITPGEYRNSNSGQ